MIDWEAILSEVYGPGDLRRTGAKVHVKRQKPAKLVKATYSWREEMARMRAELIGAK